jgi:tetratricopeptide (TPR) repeat protein
MTTRAASLLVILVCAGCGGGMMRAPGPPQPSQATLVEAKEIDEAQDLIDDGLFDQARAKLDSLAARGCRHPTMFMLQAKLAYRQGEFAQATPWCDQAIAASPLWVEPRVLLAQCYLKLERYAAAASAFGDLDRMAPESPWGPYGMGTIAAMRGDAAEATRQLDRALARDGEHAPSLEARAGVARMVQDRELEERLLRRYVAVEPLDAWALVRLGELDRASDRREDARRDLERAWRLRPLPEAAKQLMELARQRGDADEARLWAQRAGIEAPKIEKDAPK